MGVEDFLVASTIVAVVGQRLVRTLCLQCRRRAESESVDIGHLGLTSLGHTRIRAPFAPGACDKCRATGFSGRTTISEVMPMSEGLRQVILGHAESRAIRDTAVREGMRSMLAHGIEKIAAGWTTLNAVGVHAWHEGRVL
jgi:general secretion pathway protein E